MPVVEKIETLSSGPVDKVYVSIDGNKCAMWNYFNPNQVLRVVDSTRTVQLRKVCDTKINAVWSCVLSFIRWYNEETKSSHPSNK